MRATHASGAVSLTFMRLGATRVAFPTLRVARVEELEGAVPDGPASIDLARYLGIDAPTTEDVHVRLSVTDNPAGFLAMLPLSVEEVRADTVHALPEYLSTWATHRGISALVLADDALSFLLDVDVVADRHLEAERQTGKSA